uniref:High mobility group protein n=1 Tax=Panagrellus redivivus TaxID=6233 RepID=A0A7E4VH41_PANRE
MSYDPKQFQYQQVPQGSSYPVIQYQIIQQVPQQQRQHTPPPVRQPRCPVRGKTSSYGFFVKMCYEEHRKKYPSENVQVTEISSRCAEKWKTMSDDEKKRFFELASKDSERYQAEIAHYGGEAAMRRKRRVKKDPNAPKRALSAFFIFSSEKRADVAAEFPEWRAGQIAQELGRMWKTMTEEEKMVYENKAVVERERYVEELRVYRLSQQPSENDTQQQRVIVQPQVVILQQPQGQQQQQTAPVSVQQVAQKRQK